MQTLATTATALTVAGSAHTVATQLVLSVARRSIMQRMANTVFSSAERLRANDSVYQCEDITQLMTWHRNVCRVEAEREAAAPAAPATTEQQNEIIRLCGNKAVTRHEASALMLRLPYLTQQQAAQAIEALALAIWERDRGEAASLTELVDMLNAAGIGHTHLLVA